MSATTEFMKQTLFNYENSMRRTGRTTRTAEYAKETGSIMVFSSLSLGADIARKFGIKVISLDNYMREEYHRGKKPEKHVFDHFAEYTRIMRNIEKAEALIDGTVDMQYASHYYF